MSRFLPLILLLLPIQVFATAPTITGVSGASAFISTGTPTIMGGLSGSVCTNSDTTQTCNSCTATNIAADTTCTTKPLCSCNEGRIYDGLTVRLALQPNGTAATGTTTTGNEAWAQYSVNGGTKTQLGKLTANNGGAFIDFNWATICGAISNSIAGGSGTTSCETLTATSSSQVEVDIWIDTTGSNTVTPGAGQDVLVTYFKAVKPADEDVYGNTQTEGIGAFTPYPGDGQVYLTNLSSSAGFPTLSYGVSAQSVRVFPSPNSMDDSNYNSPPVSPATLALNDSGGTLANNIVNGLQNDQLYFFRIAIVDQANNVLQYFPDSTGLPDSCTSTAPSTACPYSATPSQVLGLLTKDMNCFVATAAYGSSLEPKLDTFRGFRRRFLLTNRAGRLFVDWYYRFGPKAAQFIYDKPWIRGAVRAALWPLYGFSAVALSYGLLAASSLALSLLLSLGLLFLFMGRRTFMRV